MPMRDPMLFVAATLSSVYIVAYLMRVRPTGHLASPASLYSALAALHFSIPGMLYALERGPEFVSSVNGMFAAQAMLFGFVCLLMFQLGSLLVNSRISAHQRRSSAMAQRLWGKERAFLVVAMLLSVGWLARLHVIASNAYFQILRGEQGALAGPWFAAIRMVEQFPMYALCILAIMFWRKSGPTSRAVAVALAIVVLTEISYWLPSGRKEPVFLAIVLPLLVRYLQQRRLPSVKMLVALTASAALIFPVTYVYRNAMEVGGAESGVIEIVRSAAVTAEAGWSGADKGSGEIVFQRMALLEPLSACIRLVDDGIWPLKFGTSYAQAMLSFIPRVMWPDKPDLHYGTEFGHAAGYLSKGDWLTSISVTYFGEAYLNFAWGGVVPVLLMGAVFGWLYRQTLTSKHRETWLLLYLVAMPTILYTGGTFALQVGGLIKLLPFFYVIGWLMEQRRSLKPSVVSPVVLPRA